MAVLCGMPIIQYMARSTWLSVHKLFTSCIRRCLVSRTCDWVTSALSVIYCFQFRPAFLPCWSGQPAGTAAYLVYPISDIRRRQKFWRFLVRSIQARGMTLNWLETRLPIEGSFDSEFPSIYDQCKVMDAWSRLTLRWGTCNEVHLNYVKCIIVYTHITLEVYRLD